MYTVKATNRKALLDSENFREIKELCLSFFTVFLIGFLVTGRYQTTNHLCPTLAYDTRQEFFINSLFERFPSVYETFDF